MLGGDRDERADRAGEGRFAGQVLVRLEALPESSQRIVRIAAESGTVARYALLKSVTGLPEDELIEGLRAAVLARILVAGSLVPADELTGRLARHWFAAHDAVKALRIGVRAANDAQRRHAYGEQLHMLERALQLWDRVSDPVRLALPALSLPDGYPRRGHGSDGVGLRGTDAAPASMWSPLRELVDGALATLRTLPEDAQVARVGTMRDAALDCRLDLYDILTTR
ncbi:hypothetical protein GCM10028775_47690 [Catellatospora paridis]